MLRSDNINELVAALAKAQSQFKPVYRETENPAFRSKYADLSAIISATQGALNANGLVITQAVRCNSEAKTTDIETMLAHSSGQWLSETLQLPATMRERMDAQTVGSSITYGRRYGWQSMTGVAAEVDDDGNGAADIGSKEAAQAVAKKKLTEYSERTKPQAAGKVVEIYRGKVGILPVWCFVRSDALALLMENGGAALTAYAGQSRYVMEEQLEKVHDVAAGLNMSLKEVSAPDSAKKPAEASQKAGNAGKVAS